MVEPFIGEIRMVGFNFPPRSWATCEGQLLPISQNNYLFTLLGTTFGGDGRTTFGLPDLRGRVPIGIGHGPGMSNRYWGEAGGSEKVSVTVANMPSHNHPLIATTQTGNSTNPSNLVLAESSEGDSIYNDLSSGYNLMSPVAIAHTGGNQPITNIQPFLSLYFVIALQGIPPSRS